MHNYNTVYRYIIDKRSADKIRNMASISVAIHTPA